MKGFDSFLSPLKPRLPLV